MSIRLWQFNFLRSRNVLFAEYKLELGRRDDFRLDCVLRASEGLLDFLFAPALEVEWPDLDLCRTSRGSENAHGRNYIRSLVCQVTANALFRCVSGPTEVNRLSVSKRRKRRSPREARAVCGRRLSSPGAREILNFLPDRVRLRHDFTWPGCCLLDSSGLRLLRWRCRLDTGDWRFFRFRHSLGASIPIFSRLTIDVYLVDSHRNTVLCS